MVDAATLTGAILVALGRTHAGLFDVSHMGQLLISGEGLDEALETAAPLALDVLCRQPGDELLLAVDGICKSP